MATESSIDSFKIVTHSFSTFSQKQPTNFCPQNSFENQCFTNMKFGDKKKLTVSFKFRTTKLRFNFAGALNSVL